MPQKTLLHRQKRVGKDAGLVDQTARSAGPRRAGALPGPLASSVLSGLFLLHSSLVAASSLPATGFLDLPWTFASFSAPAPLLASQGLCLLELLSWSLSHSTNTDASLDPGAAHSLVGENIWLGDNCPP